MVVRRIGVLVVASLLATMGVLAGSEAVSPPRPAAALPPPGLSTLAGSGTPGQGDGSATTATFDNVSDLAIDATGANLYTLDIGIGGRPNSIRKIATATGAVTTIASGGLLAGSPTHIEVDGNGDPWVALRLSGNEKAIVKYSQTGVATTMLDGICCAYYGNADLVGDAFEIDVAGGYLYYSAAQAPGDANTWEPHIFRIALGSLPADATAGSDMGETGHFVRGPVRDMDMGPDGRLYIVWEGTGPWPGYAPQIFRLDGVGSFTELVSSWPTHYRRIAFAPKSLSLYSTCDFWCASIERRANGGTGMPVTIAGSPTQGDRGFQDGDPGKAQNAQGLVISPDGTTAYMTDAGNHRIRQVLLPPDPFELSPEELCGSCNPGQRRLSPPKVLDPVDVATGTLTETFTDIVVPGRGVPAAVTRTYNSLRHDDVGLFGPGWSSPLDTSLTEASGVISIHQENGSLLPFARMPDDSIVAPPRVTSTLEEVTGGWRLTRNKTDIVTFDTQGRVSGFEDQNGNVTTVTRPSSSQIVITTPGGRTLTLAVNGSGRVTSVSDDSTPARTVTYGYTSNRLTSVASFKVNPTDTGVATWGYAYDGNGRLNRVTDPRGRSNLTHYDAQGRVDYQHAYSLAGGTAGARSDITYGGTWPNEHRIVTLPAYNVSGTRAKVRYDLSGLVTTSMTTGYQTASARTTEYEYFPGNLFLKKITVAGVVQGQYTYDTAGNILTATDAAGRVTTYAGYDAFNNAGTVTDNAGNASSFTYDGNGNLTQASVPVRPVGGALQGNAVTTYHRDDPSHPEDVTRVRLPDQQGAPTPKDVEVSYRAGDGQVTWAEDPEGNRTSYTYDSRGYAATVTTARGNATPTAGDFTTSFTVNDFGMTVSSTDATGEETSRVFDGNGNLTSLTDPNGQVTTTEYDDMDRPRVVHRPDGTDIETQYFPNGTVRSQIDGLGQATTYTYDVHGSLATVTDANGSTTTYGHDTLGRLIRRAEPGGTCPATRCTTYGYDAGNQLTSVSYTDPATPDVTGVTYDALGQRTAVTRSAGGSQTWTWDNVGQLRSATDVNGRTTAYGWSLGGNLASITYPGQATPVTYSYDAAGRMTSLSDWAGRSTTFAHDADSNWTTTTFPAATSNVDTRTYDPAGRLGSVTWKQGATTLGSMTYDRDPEGLVDEEQTSSTGFSTRTWGYDEVDQLDQVGATALDLDDGGNLIRTEDGTHQVFDPAHQLCWTSPTASGPCATPAADATTYAYDLRGNRGLMERADGSTVEYGYDQENQMVSLRDGSERPLSDQVGITDSGDFDGDGIDDVLWWTPDTDDEVISWGSSTRGRVGADSTTYTFDTPHERLIADFDGDGNDDIFYYGTSTIPDEIWFFDGRGVNDYSVRTISVNGTYRPVAGDFDGDGFGDIYWYAPGTGADTIWWGHTNVDTGTAFTSQAVSRGGDHSPVSGDIDNNGFDDIVWYTPGTGADDVYFAAGSRNSWLSRAVTINGTYELDTGDVDGDGKDDLMFTPAAGGGTIWWGNTANGFATTTQKAVSIPAGAQAAMGDHDGDGTDDAFIDTDGGTDTMWWGTTRTDFATAAAAIGLPTDPVIATYGYDSDGLRTAKTVGTTTTQFTWNRAAGLPLLLSQHEGAATTRIVYGPGGTPLYQDGPGGVAYYHQDHQGSTRLVTSSAGAVAGRTTYDAYGSVESTTVPSGLRPLLGYTGEYADAETGFIYLRARYMDPVTGQFTTRDPIGAATREPYSYASGDPVNRLDPTGLCGFLGDGPCTPGGVVDDINERGDQVRDELGICSDFVDEDCESIAEENPEQAQAAADFAGGVLDINPITAFLPLDLEAHGVNTSSGWYRGGQATMFVVDLALTGTSFRQLFSKKGLSINGARCVRAHIDDAVHKFPDGRMIGRHLQIDTWVKKAKGSHKSWRWELPKWFP
jgi:RHS repeat-associated protein